MVSLFILSSRMNGADIVNLDEGLINFEDELNHFHPKETLCPVRDWSKKPI